jgi:hypothetical protein
VTRRLDTADRLRRLRQELAAIAPGPGSPLEARDEIVNAMQRAGLDGWTVPALDDAAATCCPHGTVCVRLTGHRLLMNRGGAFGIVDLATPRSFWFQMRGRDSQPYRTCSCMENAP